MSRDLDDMRASFTIHAPDHDMNDFFDIRPTPLVLCGSVIRV